MQNHAEDSIFNDILGPGSNGFKMQAPLLCLLLLTSVTRVGGADFTNPVPVAIEGYHDQAMEPFLSRDGRVLMFNNSNDPQVNTDLHWAERVTPLRFRYRGKIVGANTNALEGVPSMDRDGTLYFVSLRSYRESLSTIYRGRFSRGRVSELRLVDGVSRKEMGKINFDAEISADGQYLYAVDGFFGGGPVPKVADIFIARQVGERFERLANSAAITANINTSALEYAPAISADGLELFFTRMTGMLFWRKLVVMHATRSTVKAPFGPAKAIEAISGFVEAPTVSGDGRSLYYHKKIDDMHRLFRVTRP